MMARTTFEKIADLVEDMAEDAMERGDPDDVMRRIESIAWLADVALRGEGISAAMQRGVTKQIRGTLKEIKRRRREIAREMLGLECTGGWDDAS